MARKSRTQEPAISESSERTHLPSMPFSCGVLRQPATVKTKRHEAVAVIASRYVRRLILCAADADTMDQFPIALAYAFVIMSALMIWLFITAWE